ncbi:RNA polymerase sigma factor [Euzebya tangerina]|uniref:RNA polymerase sigma factor n=1 Tax=Euzebya tangerina TaxID=591198 RepID=UPI000E313003|nr:sigma-70 family RNA polymerase sigma factor [Euzebya tangerina]
MEVGDEELLAQFVAGDAQAFSALVSRHRERTYAICWRFFRNDADAEDATQEAFVRLYRNAASFRGTASFNTWMYRLTTNVCHDIHRRRARRPQSAGVDPEHLDRSDRAPVSPGGPVADAIRDAELRLDLREALAELQEDQRTALVMHVFLGFSYREIAERTNVAVGTVKSRIHRATAALDTAWRRLDGRSGTTAAADPSNARPDRPSPTRPARD